LKHSAKAARHPHGLLQGVLNLEKILQIPEVLGSD
jgi:hypothetical protein